MKKYLVFTYYVGRPLGGAKDFLDAFDSIEEALENIKDAISEYLAAQPEIEERFGVKVERDEVTV